MFAHTLNWGTLKAKVVSKQVRLGVKEKAVKAPGGQEVGRQARWGGGQVGEIPPQVGNQGGAKAPHQGAVVWAQRASQLVQRRRGS